MEDGMFTMSEIEEMFVLMDEYELKEVHTCYMYVGFMVLLIVESC